MAKKYLIINSGSASGKYSLYANEKELAYAHYEAGEQFVAQIRLGNQVENLTISKAEFDALLQHFLNKVLAANLLRTIEEIAAVGIRVVCPGIFFQRDRLIDHDFIEHLNTLAKNDPIHSQGLILSIENIKKILPAAQLTGVSDSYFHAKLPKTAKYYGLPKSDSDALEIFRFGYHGLSLESVTEKLPRLLGQMPEKTIICHLGSGASITALKNGKSLDTSMGFSPLEGLLMSSRVGDIDAGAIIYLGRQKGLDWEKLERYLYQQSGLLGLSDHSSDLRVLLGSEKSNDQLAVEAFVYRIVKYIGAYTAVLGGLDCLVFTGTIGERSSIIRARVCDKLKFLGIALDQAKNEAALAQDQSLESGSSPVKIAVIAVDENAIIFRHLRA
ncbi:MAG: hypothetical protein A3B10_03780 [Candidatus Doudnabacteria bacterium RIFCSPLOWO2_01_FULL_44_21]|uniref:Acetate kinase n=1 Tax=Candidatus Doudnabacteria bacterium RIFCSPLOWO2_01_FULL_44_21 TaxID=1817841 RepID=A0A1F5PZ65_9BACT|nr:MAG: hypothetical protein A3B95_02065 [Candidatus Doudnabacteria bacterium RIFCSPHIGHO2_02_FULL_43_13b]OGE94880.1 MAG: hypothetical protein A3B10_03780 [Candidatus Doudnabacteria bacterium RIFCSPLOWO2_01_FULL_44_21]